MSLVLTGKCVSFSSKPYDMKAEDGSQLSGISRKLTVAGDPVGDLPSVVHVVKIDKDLWDLLAVEKTQIAEFGAPVRLQCVLAGGSLKAIGLEIPVPSNGK